MTGIPTRRRGDGVRRALATGALSVALIGLAAPGAQAADAGALDHARPTESGVELLVSLPSGSSPDLDRVAVTVGGREVEAAAVPASGADTERRTAVLALDTGVDDARLGATQAAASSYLDAVPADVEVGLVGFDDDVTVLLEPTRDRGAARTAITELAPGGGTALYDGVLGAVAAAGDDAARQRSVLLLSAGADSTGTALSTALREVEASGVLLDAVAFALPADDTAPLQLLAQAGRGQVLDAADPVALEGAFASAASRLARQVAVTAAVPGDSGRRAEVTVTVPMGDSTVEPVTASGTVELRPGAGAASGETAATGTDAQQPGLTEAATGAEAASTGRGIQLSDVLVWGGVGGIGLGLLGLVLAAALTAPGPDRDQKLRTQLEAYGVFGASSGPATGSNEAAGSFGDQARGAAAKALAQRAGLEAAIADRLDAAGMHLKPAEWLLLHGGIVIGATTLGLLLGQGNLLLALLCLVGASVGPGLYLRLRKGKRLKAFAAGLPDTLQLMSSSLSAGLSLAQSIDTIVREGADPISGEFRRIVVETRLGVSLEDAMDGVAERMDSRDFTWVVMAIRIQREVGGNLAELLLQVASTLRERDFLRRHVRALSAEGRLSAWVLGGLPPAFLAYLSLTRPAYVSVFFTDPRGWFLLGGMVVLLSIGVLWMSKAATVKL